MNQIGIFDVCYKKHKGNSNSKAANPTKERKSVVQDKIVQLLSRKRMTGKEIAEILGKPFNAISGRFSELKALKRIRGTGVRKDGSELLEAA